MTPLQHPSYQSHPSTRELLLSAVGSPGSQRLYYLAKPILACLKCPRMHPLTLVGQSIFMCMAKTVACLAPAIKYIWWRPLHLNQTHPHQLFQCFLLPALGFSHLHLSFFIRFLGSGSSSFVHPPSLSPVLCTTLVFISHIEKILNNQN